MKSEFGKIFQNFPKVKVLVVGDVMLDRYWWGSMNRISPEAPVPIVNLEKESYVAGGAANVAANIKGLGATPYLVSIIGDDANGKLLKDALERIKVSSKYLLELQTRPTTVKTRIIAHNQQVGRIDHEVKEDISQVECEKVIEKCLALINQVDIVIISDYLKGLLTSDFLLRLITTCNLSDKKIIVDPKGKDFKKYKNATILTPNQKEAYEATGKDDVLKAAEYLMKHLDLESLLITRGEDGMSVFPNKKESYQLDSLARHVYDVTGAGDTVIATLAASLAAGADLKIASEIANVAAGCVVEEVGTTGITFERLKKEFL